MKFKIALLSIIVFCLSINTFSQTKNQSRNEPRNAEETLKFISGDLRTISNTVKSLNSEIVKAYSSLTSNLGLKLTDDQQKILVSFEILNRAEQRLGTLQKLKIELIEKQVDINSRLAEVELELRRESIEKNVALQGTTNAEELRDKRRQLLNRQKRNLGSLLAEIQSSISQINTELRQTTRLVDQIRYRLFPAIYRELPKLEYEN